jgi:hypothetical protein
MRTRHLGAVLLALFLALPAFGQDKEEKKVPGTDKSSGELIGTVAGVTTTSRCGVRAAIVVLSIKGVYPFTAPEAALCVGGILSQCVALHAGQRVRLLGQIYSVPDLTTPGVNPCDSSTWQYLLPTFGFRVTQVIK